MSLGSRQGGDGLGRLPKASSSWPWSLSEVGEAAGHLGADPRIVLDEGDVGGETLSLGELGDALEKKRGDGGAEDALLLGLAQGVLDGALHGLLTGLLALGHRHGQ